MASPSPLSETEHTRQSQNAGVDSCPAELRIESCKLCHPDDADLPFDWILEQITGTGGMVDFVMLETARCPTCKQPLTEKTLVEPN